MKVMGARVLLRRLPEQRYTLAKDSKLHVVQLEEEPSMFADVIATGMYYDSKGRQQFCDVKEGDRVIIKKHCGTPVEINNETLYFVMFDDVLAKVK